MHNTTFVALSSQIALQRQMDVLANNIANLSTPAFKGEAKTLMGPKNDQPRAE